jgi:Glycosyl hydrolase catalytic core
MISQRRGVHRCTYSDPFDWWKDFFGNCSAMYTGGCRVDFIAMHMCAYKHLLLILLSR